jgi:YfiH family protein
VFAVFLVKKWLNLYQISKNKKHMLILKAQIFQQFPEIIFGFSSKIGADRDAPFYFNVSDSVGDDENIVSQNRKLFFNTLGLKPENVALQRQVHGDKVTYVEGGGVCGESDAMFTDRNGLGLAVSTADCTAIFLYDKKNKVIAGIHSGWRGTSKKILKKTLERLEEKYGTSPTDLSAYLGPSICQSNYEVGEEVAGQFDKKYHVPLKGKYFLDVSQVNYDILLNFGVKSKNIQLSSLCSFELKDFLHSYRRDGLKSGRALGVIAMRN